MLRMVLAPRLGDLNLSNSVARLTIACTRTCAQVTHASVLLRMLNHLLTPSQNLRGIQFPSLASDQMELGFCFHRNRGSRLPVTQAVERKEQRDEQQDRVW